MSKMVITYYLKDAVPFRLGLQEKKPAAAELR